MRHGCSKKNNGRPFYAPKAASQTLYWALGVKVKMVEESANKQTKLDAAGYRFFKVKVEMR